MKGPATGATSCCVARSAAKGCRRPPEEHGLAAVLGFVSETGVAGLTLGGGFGYLTRRFSRITDEGWLPTRPEVVSFLAPTTIAHWGTVLLFNQVTVIVIQRFGPVYRLWLSSHALK